MHSGTPKGPGTLLGVGTFIVAILALAVNIAGQKLPGPYQWAPIACLVLLGILWAGPRLWRRAATQWSLYRRLRRIRVEWPSFRARVTTLRDFYQPSRPGGLDDLLRNKVKPRPPANAMEDARTDAKIQATTQLLSLMDRLTSHLVTDVHGLPRSIQSARRAARDFEQLMKVLEFQGIGPTLRLMEPAPSYPEVLNEFWRAYERLRSDYLIFSREANERIGDNIFDGE